MSTAIDTTSEVDAIEHLDFEPEQLCEATSGCDNHASFAMRCKSCTATVLWCTACRIRFEVRLARLGEYVVQCIFCRAATTNFEALFAWLPLKGRS